MIDSEEAIRTAELWEAGKMNGGDQDEVIKSLLAEVKRLRSQEKLKTTLILAKKYIRSVGSEAEARHDDPDGDLYMDSVQYEKMKDSESLIRDIDAILADID